MKLPLVCLICVTVATVLAALVGYGPTSARWGEAGVECMVAAGLICVVASIFAMVPLSLAAAWSRTHIGEAALAATVLRLLLTMGLSVGYQMFARPELGPFLLWALVFYGLVLVIETTFSVLMVRRAFGNSGRGVGTA